MNLQALPQQPNKVVVTVFRYDYFFVYARCGIRLRGHGYFDTGDLVRYGVALCRFSIRFRLTKP